MFVLKLRLRGKPLFLEIQRSLVALFDHENFDNFVFKDIPLNQDIYIVSEVYLHEYESSMVKFFEGAEYPVVGYVSYAAARSVNNHSLKLSWYPNIFDRFHEVSLSLPFDQFVTCVGSWRYDEKPRIFVNSNWLEQIYLRTYSIFALIDAIDVKKALEKGTITREKLIGLREEIDLLAENYRDISFISFGDSLLLKSNWSVGYFKKGIEYTYKPETFIGLAGKINDVYQNILGLRTYALIAQGSNEYYDDPLLHISKTRNHISLNSLGIPFSQLVEIEGEARKAIKSGTHPPAELYMDKFYFNSLKFKPEFERDTVPHSSYQAKMMRSPSEYYYSSLRNVVENLKPEE